MGLSKALVVALSTSDSNNCPSEVVGLSNALMVALSTCDAGKWFTIQKWLDSSPRTVRDQHKSSSYYGRRHKNGQQDFDGPGGQERLRQVQRRLTVDQVDRMCQKYRDGASARALSREFGIDRRTVAIRLKKAGISMRHSKPLPAQTMYQHS